MKGVHFIATTMLVLAWALGRNTTGKTLAVVTADYERWQLKHHSLYFGTDLKFFSGSK